MDDFQVWKLTVDALLVGALLLLCYRFARTSAQGPSANAAVLEASLRALVREADAASNSFQAELTKRQKNLEQLLFDLESVETRVNRAVQSGEELKTSIELEVRKQREIQRPLAVPPKEELAPAAGSVTSQPTIRRGAPPEPPSFDQLTVPTRKRPGTPLEAKIVKNIYGQPVAQHSTQARTHKHSLKHTLEKEVSNTSTPQVTTKSSDQEVTAADVQRVYDTAEALLKTGTDLQQVATKTKLPLNEIRMLARLLEQEQQLEADSPPANVAAADQRLGVLSPIRRETETL